MKKSIKLFALVMALVLCTLALVSCSTFGSIKSNFEKNGYELKGESEKASFTYEDYEINYTVHTFQVKTEDSDSALGDIIGGITQGLSTAVVWEFGSNEDLAKALANNEDVKAALKDADESEMVNGNCVLMTLNPDAVKIFNGESIEK
ncbi:MAG: hypothetical protein IJY71_07770 [Clostridia bacterium]|nr:hypothetical protein [Clostridia bacterium]